MRPDAIRDEGLRELGVHGRLDRIAFGANHQPRPYEERLTLFSEYKVELKKARKSLARELHPDMNGDLTEGERTRRADKFNRVMRAIDHVLGLEIKPPAVMYQTTVRVTVIGFGGGNGWGFGGATIQSSGTVNIWDGIIIS